MRGCVFTKDIVVTLNGVLHSHMEMNIHLNSDDNYHMIIQNYQTEDSNSSKEVEIHLIVM